MKISAILTAAGIGLAAPVSAYAATLNLDVTADNQFSVYLSTNDAVLGTLIGTGNNWQQDYSFSVPLLPGNNYIQVIGTNYTTANGFPQFGDGSSPSGFNPNGFVGSFSISGVGYQFLNGSSTDATNTTDWVGLAVGSPTWTLPTGPTLSYGANGQSGVIWTTVLSGPVAGISTQANWIWSNPDNFQYAVLSTEIVANATPLPAALPLFAGGLGVVALLARRKKRKNAIAIAVA